MAMSLTRDLLDRRVPQYMAVYLGVCWGLVEFFDLMENRFLLSPHLTNFVLLLAALLFPSVVLFTYFHGRPGADRWRRVEKVLIPINVALTVLILFVVFSGKELGAMTTTVMVEDEEGNTIERVVPKSEFRKRLVVFPLDTDSSTAWLGDAVANALVTDLYQDMFLDLRIPAMFREDLRKAGFPDARQVPAALKRRIAQERHLGYIVDGAVARTADGYELTVALHDARRGRLLQTRTHEGPDLLALVDDASLQLRRDLGLPSRHIEETVDLPVAEILTGSMDALRHQTEAGAAVWVRDDYAGAAEHMRRAVEEDPTFALAQVGLYQIRLAMGDTEGAKAALQQAMDHLYRLPERSQYSVRGEWYAMMQEDFPRSFAVLEMWAELYPQDLQAQLTAAQIRLFQDDRRGAIEKFEHVLRLDPTQSERLRQLGALYEAVGEPDRALVHYNRYADLFPENKESYSALARLHHRAGDHAKAREAYERALLLEPGDTDIMVARARLDRDLGLFDAALTGFEAALAAARTPDQRITALRGLQGYFAYRGAYVRALEYTEQALSVIQASQPPVAQIQIRLLTLPDWIKAGRGDAALEMLESLAAQLSPPLDALVPLGRIGVYEALERPEELERAVAEGREMLERTSLNMLLEPVVQGQARLHELRGEWRDAIASYEEQRTLDPTDLTIAAVIGRCYREAGDFRRAERLIQETLAGIPSHPRSHYELALVYERMRRPAAATRHFRLALDGWEIADEHHPFVGLARDRLTRLAD